MPEGLPYGGGSEQRFPQTQKRHGVHSVPQVHQRMSSESVEIIIRDLGSGLGCGFFVVSKKTKHILTALIALMAMPGSVVYLKEKQLMSRQKLE